MHRNVSSAHVFYDKDKEVVKLGSYASIIYNKYLEERLFEKKARGEWFYLSPLAIKNEKEYGKEDDVWHSASSSPS